MNTALALDPQAILTRALSLTQEDCFARLPQGQRERILEERSPLRMAEHLAVAFWVVNPHYDGRGGNEKPVARAVGYEEMLVKQCALYRLGGGEMERLLDILQGWLRNSSATVRDGTLGEGMIEIRSGKSYVVE